ncbi:Gfo/Idh/MocA family oxidoreductase [Phragmitibacter flavus]|uniref:Gfo/Idh/MocA family oxidoreductase n=1 Tax=Phragmitibacter flavus TaxID=2576071 RepID=A0A5R8KJB0_9BACT|nr:Gfo/Idh/MocA family oxidoreductase [Phragmitibacter flavus]TLD72418.1 Gfo/Idh/MocA family oxidoreductase [Phragmitibacter flavus]
MTQTIGIILNGVTGRMGTNQHLIRSILAIIEQGGVKVSNDLTIMPDPILTGRNPEKLAALAKRTGVSKWSTDLPATLADPQYSIFFDASGTLQRAGFVEQAAAAGKAIYCEKPTAVETAEALRLAQVCEDAGVKNGVVQDKLWLPGIRKFRVLRDQGFFGKILSVRGEFGYWVFSGEHEDQPAQRPSWNYRTEDGGGIIIDMLCHWRYVIDNLFGNVTAVSCLGATHIPQRRDESGETYPATSDDACYATFETDTGVICQFNSSWTTRVRRDDLFTMHVDGTHGSAVVSLRKCWVQSLGSTPRPTWNPDIEQPINFFTGWQEVPDALPTYDNAFKIQWEMFLKHVATDAPFPYTLREGAKGVQLAEAGLQSWADRKWVSINPL